MVNKRWQQLAGVDKKKLNEAGIPQNLPNLNKGNWGKELSAKPQTPQQIQKRGVHVGDYYFQVGVGGYFAAGQWMHDEPKDEYADLYNNLEGAFNALQKVPSNKPVWYEAWGNKPSQLICMGPPTLQQLENVMNTDKSYQRMQKRNRDAEANIDEAEKQRRYNASKGDAAKDWMTGGNVEKVDYLRRVASMFDHAIDHALDEALTHITEWVEKNAHEKFSPETKQYIAKEIYEEMITAQLEARGRGY